MHLSLNNASKEKVIVKITKEQVVQALFVLFSFGYFFGRTVYFSLDKINNKDCKFRNKFNPGEINFTQMIPKNS